MIIKTGRFGQLKISKEEVIQIPQGVLGFPEYKEYCLVDPGDETLILWLQSIQNPHIVFPVLEPKIFKNDYLVRLSSNELRELKLETVNQSAVFTILTIPSDISQMSANLKAPLVINLKDQLGKQVILQENEYTLKQEMFKDLRAHLITIESHHKKTKEEPAPALVSTPISVKNIPPSQAVKALQN